MKKNNKRESADPVDHEDEEEEISKGTWKEEEEVVSD